MKINSESLKEILSTIVEKASEERKKSDSYKDMFELTTDTNFTALLRDIKHKMMKIIIDTCDIIETKTNKRINNTLMDILLAFPYIQAELAKEISQKEGISCCVDKSYYILNKFIKDNLK